MALSLLSQEMVVGAGKYSTENPSETGLSVSTISTPGPGGHLEKYFVCVGYFQSLNVIIIICKVDLLYLLVLCC